MVTERDLTWGRGHTMQHTDRGSQKCTLEICMILLTNKCNFKKGKKKEEGGERKEWGYEGKGGEEL